jgi:tripartite-type tricarboxylate transporter receptor subunit TctC
MTRTALIAASLIALFSTPAHAQMAVWPQRTVRVITPVATGGGVDLAARVFAEKLSWRWGQPVVIENRPGGDGIVGVASFIATKDDHTLLFTLSATMGVHPVINDKLPFDPWRDLAPIAPACNVLIGFAATRAVAIETLADFVEQARKEPGKLNWAAGPGLPQFVMGAFQAKRDLQITPVFYRDARQPVQDLAEGRIHLLATSLATLLPLAQASKIRLLAISGKERAAIVPDVPTVLEAGYPELSMDGFVGFYAHAGVADDVRTRIVADVRAIAEDPQIRDRIKPAGLTPRPGTTAEFIAALEEQRARMIALAQQVRLPLAGQ